MDERLRIGILCHPTYGGSGVVASELAISLAEAGHSVHLFSHEVPPRLARSAGMVQMHRAQGVPYPLFHSTPHDLAITSAVLEVHRDTGLDIVHAHYALPHAVSAFLARSAAQADRGRPAPRTVTTLHGTDITLVGNDPSYAPLTQFVISASDAATAVSDWLARETIERFCPEMLVGCDIEVIPNFVDAERFHPDAGRGVQLCGGSGCPVAVHVSNFRPVKRVPWLVRAFGRALGKRDARLLLVGDGPDQGQARQVAHDLGIADKVLFLGERDALPELLAPADVFVLSSRQESFGLSALEAMSCGTPVVATDSGGVHEVVDHDETGLLTPLEDLEGFARHLAALLFDRDRARAMGAAAREVAVARFRREAVVQRYVDLYRRTLAGNQA
jgi:N-acetyl-alpha-D-glucosaminyl L-malate synthase BshA